MSALADAVNPGRSAPASAGCTCPDAANCRCDEQAAPAMVYAIGRILPRYPNLGVEKEFQQALGRAEAPGATDAGARHHTLSQAANRYLARSMCWVFSVEGVDTYILQPAESQDLDLLIEATRPRPRTTDIDVVIGYRGGIAPARACNGLSLPVVHARQVYSFDIDGLIAALPRGDGDAVDAEDFEASAEELFQRLMLMADNAGATDAHRATNYLAVRYDAIYQRIARMHDAGAALSSIATSLSPLGGARRIIDVVFAFRDRRTDVEDRFSTSVDVTELYPFLVRKLSPSY